jgi:hypothetical protein
VGHQDYFLALLPGSIALFVSSLGIDIVHYNPSIMGKPLMSHRTSWETPRGRYDEYNSKSSLSYDTKV